MDSGIEPTIEKGLRGINVYCAKWSTLEGLHVGSTMKEVSNWMYGRYCESTRENGSMLVAFKQGIWFDAKDRHSPVSRILVVPKMDTWGGLCTD